MPISSSRDRLTVAVHTPDRPATTGDIIESDNKEEVIETSAETSKSKDTVKPRKVTLPSIEKLKIDKEKTKVTVTRNVVGISLSHGSAMNKHQPLSSPHHVKAKSVHHHPGHRTPHPHPHRNLKKRKPKREKEGDDITLRKIRYFSSHPKPAPYTLCLSYPGVDLSHRELLGAITSLGTIDKADVRSIQFVDMNCILGTAGVDNRWLVTVKDFDTRYLLLRDCIWLNDDPLHFRLLDDVNMEDYKEYKRRMATLESDEHVSAVERLLALHGQL